MAGTTTPDSISFADTSDPQNLPSITGAMASSIQAALNVRQIKQYFWPNAAARNAQTGMAVGYLGMQSDTLTLYMFDGIMWRPYAGQMPLLQVGKTNGGLIPVASTGTTMIAFDTTTLTRGDVSTFYTFSSGAVTLNVSGFYRFYYGAEFSNPSTTDNSRRQARLYVNGSATASSVASVANNTSSPQTTIANNVWASARSAGDTITVGAGHGYSTSLAVNNMGTVLAVEYVGS